MFEEFKLFPEAASSIAGDIDAIYFFLVGMTFFAVAGIFSTLIFFSLRYRRRKKVAAQQIEGSVALEIFWSAVPMILWVFVFGWSAKVYLTINSRPIDGMEFYVTGKQWMWKIQHPTGQREINALHVPVGETIILDMISEDVIHDFYVPAFRIKQDVVPGMYSTVWFQPTKVGRYHLFCAEYCGTKHSEMIGEVIVMDPADYQAWLEGQPAGMDPVDSGRVLFENLRCVTCHDAGSGQRGPDLAGLYGTDVKLASGETILFDENYVRTSILEPKRHVSAGYEPLMPTYEGQITQGQIGSLIAYIKSLAEARDETPATGGDEQ